MLCQDELTRRTISSSGGNVSSVNREHTVKPEYSAGELERFVATEQKQKMEGTM
jgi:hypothetical protein